MSLKDHLSSISSAVILGGAVAFFAIVGLCETIPNWKLRNYYHRALQFYADTSGNGRIEPEEEAKFVLDFNTDIKKLPGYENFNLRADEIPKSSIDARTILPLLRQYRPVPPF